MVGAITQERWARIKVLFHDALEIPADGREIYLDSACGDDPVVRGEVARLIGNYDDTLSFLDQPLTVCARISEALDARPPIFRPGDLVNGRFRVVRFIGAGGMGEVYHVADGFLGTDVALKTIRSGIASDKGLEARFRSEVQISRKITHPNVCRIYDLFETRVEGLFPGTSREILFLTMELLEGESLADRLARSGRMSASQALPLVRDIVAAMEAAHRQSVIHRDLKSSNVMLVTALDGTTKAVLTDFGLACSEHLIAGLDEGRMGTPDYMAPEQLEDGEIGFATDIFALGVLLNEMLTGQKPFASSSGLGGALRRSRSMPIPPRALVADIDARWEAVILKCLAYKPENRFRTAGELLAALEPIEGPSRITRRVAVASAAAGVVGLCGWLWKTKRPASISSIAILPFDNRSSDDDLKYFAEGLTGDLIPMLTRFRGLRVVAPTQSQMKGVSGTRAVGRIFNVGTVLTGTVRKEHARISVVAQLTNVADGMPLWSGSYAEDVKTLPRIRLNLSMEIAGALQPRLPKAQLADIVGPQSENADAYNLYLLGKHYASYRSEDGLKRSIDYLSQSVAFDPRFAPAYAALSDVYSIRAGQIGCPPQEYISKAEEAAERALRLNPRSGEAHTALGFAFGRKWDWRRSESEFHSALECNPQMAIAHYRYAGLHSVLGRPQRAIDEVLVARDLDPLSQLVHAGFGAFLFRARRYDQALVQLQKTLEAFPDSAAALSNLGQLYDATGRFSEAIAAHRKSLEIGPGYYYRYSSRLAYSLARAGYREQAREIASELAAGLGQSHYSPMAVADVYRGLGELDKAFYWYDMSIQQRDPHMEIINVDPLNDGLRDDARFKSLVQQLGLS